MMLIPSPKMLNSAPNMGIHCMEKNRGSTMLAVVYPAMTKVKIVPTNARDFATSPLNIKLRHPASNGISINNSKIIIAAQK
jgi:hypothetical protein